MKMNQNAAYYFLDRHIEEGREEKIAFQEIDGQKRQISYGELSQKTSLFAGALMRADIRREERIAMIVQDEIEFPIIFFGAMKAGVIPIPLNTLLSASIYEQILNDSRANMLFISNALYETVKPLLNKNPYLRKTVIIGGEDSHTQSFHKALINS